MQRVFDGDFDVRIEDEQKTNSILECVRQVGHEIVENGNDILILHSIYVEAVIMLHIQYS